MKCQKKYMQLYAVTDRAWAKEQSLYEQVEAALKGGVTAVQLREKHLSEEEYIKEACEMKKLCAKYGVPLFINDNVKVALACHADGIHVGQNDMDPEEVRALVGDDMMIGVSAHSVEEAQEAVRKGADCLGVGAAFATSTKSDAKVLPPDMLQAISKSVDVPIVAIGGINRDNLPQLAGTGISGVALVSAIFAAKEIEQETRALFQMTEELFG
ncbi:MAG: thiamine phosphate synthase [Agathobacter sp.]|uniref:thiamine phosphate synthase n=1 Tax=Agathobacter sp. TaxID=2021311 RepID=UPI0004E0ED49|nr:thiamine phosphate synthase [Agathobacter sp.]MBQ1681430.1 thiamine phosphate synthase [Agathobacter sp.]